jgi:hypothetical protein
MDKYIEYNLINNIPILYPDKRIKYKFSPRYAIAKPEYMIKCFTDNAKINTIDIMNVKLNYIKIEQNLNFKTLNNEIKSLYFYIIIEQNTFINVDYTDYNSLIKWLKTNINNHYILITTPVLQYKNIYYNIANDNNMSIYIHNINDLSNDCYMIDKLINNNCFTICDNFNIIISLYSLNIINRKKFIESINIINTLKNFCYTSRLWIDLMQQHRILNSCDFPIIFLMQHCNSKIDKEIFELFEWYIFDRDHNIYMQTYYEKEILFTTLLSSCYPNINMNILKLILGKNIINNLWINKKKLLGNYYEDLSVSSIFYNDYYSIFANIVHVKNMWNFWCENKINIINNLISTHDNKDLLYFLYSNILIALFNLYNNGYDGIKIKRNRISMIWNDIIDINPQNLKITISDLIQLHKNIKIPYKFLIDIYYKCNLNLKTEYIYILNINNIYTYQYNSLYNIFKQEIPYYFNNHIHKRIIYILIYIYKKFKMFKNDLYTNQHIIGELLINHLKINIESWI